MLLAGGSGTRFWPLSRRSRPKPFLKLLGSASLLRAAWDRALALAPPERVWVVAPARLANAVRRELPGLRPANLVREPSPRDTAPAVALACAAVARRDAEAVVAIFPTDQAIRKRAAFARAVRTAARVAADGPLVCLGIAPDRPATGFGYLRVAGRKTRGAFRVERFVEKPDARRARAFLRSGRYLWNGGMFVWKAGAFLEEAARVAPAVHAAAVATAAGRRGRWASAPRISVDYAVMEKARDVRVVPLDAGWDDVGSWEAAVRLGGSGGGPGVRIDSPGSVVFGGRRFVALVGLPGVVVVDTDDALLVASREAAERVKAVVAAVRDQGRNDLL